MSRNALNIHQSAQKEQSEFVFVRSHYRRRPRHRPTVPLDPLIEKEVCKRFMLAMVEQRRKKNKQLRECERERLRTALVEAAALRKQLHAYRLGRCYSSIIEDCIAKGIRSGAKQERDAVPL